MKKIPLEATIIDAYKFFFQNILSIIGTVWFPVLLFVGLLAGLIVGLLPHEWLTGNFVKVEHVEDYFVSHAVVFLLALPLLELAGLLLGAMIKVGVLRLALGQTHGTTWFYFSLGARVWRMVAAVFVYAFMWFVVALVAALAVVLIATGLSAIPNNPQWVQVLVTVILAIAAVFFVLYTMIRMFFFLPAVIVAENQIGLRRSWALGRGNVWRIVVIALAIFIPIQMIATIISYATVLPTIFVQVAHMSMQPTPQEGLAFLVSLWPLIPTLVLIWTFAGLSMAGILLGAMGKAYKAVTADPLA